MERARGRRATRAGRAPAPEQTAAIDPAEASLSGAPDASAILALQRGAGNHAVGRALNRSATSARRWLLRWDSFEHVALGDAAPGGPSALITLQSHDRDFPERGDQSRWPAAWRTRLASADT